jgi:mRNA-degrading endonuclease toxin of MazEF toxin-antitoxin module
MGQYVKGDVLLASVALDDRTLSKTRPVVVIGTEGSGRVHICPVSSKQPADAPCIPISLDDFSDGGLDLFGESYVMTSRVLTLSSGKVIGKKGRLTPESLAEIAGRVPVALLPGPAPGKKPGRPRKGR